MFITPPQFIITAGIITAQSVHGLCVCFSINKKNYVFTGLPCIIYLLLNKSVREELYKWIGVKQQQTSVTVRLGIWDGLV